MAFRLMAPLPSPETTSVLPNPQFNDTQARKLSINFRRSMDNTKRSYVKTSQRQAVNYPFTLTRMKALELAAFVDSYFASKWRWIDHRGRVWEGYLMRNPFEQSTEGRAAGVPGGEHVSVELQLEGELQE